MKMEIIKTKEQARQKAIDWQNWQAGQNLSYAELSDWWDYFTKLAKKFGLKKEFKENGIV